MTHTDPTAARLHRAILLDRDDDARRLVYAERLEEIGEGERAEFIRLQCRIAALEAACGCGGCVRKRGGGQQHNGPCAVDQERDELLDGRTRAARLRMREGNAWAGDRHGGDKIHAKFFAELPGWCVAISSTPWSLKGQPAAIVRRGLVSEVRCTLDDFTRHAAAIFRTHPVERVVLTDMFPVAPLAAHPDSVRWRAWGTTAGPAPSLPQHLPDEIFKLLPQAGRVSGHNGHFGDWWACYESERLALDAVSTALVTWGRRQAGLEVRCGACGGKGTRLSADIGFTDACTTCEGTDWVPDTGG